MARGESKVNVIWASRIGTGMSGGATRERSNGEGGNVNGDR